MNKGFWSLVALGAFLTALTNPVNANAQQPGKPRSATLATDVNGFRLGMTVAEARAITPLSFIGGNQFNAETDGFAYNFGVTPRGRIYRIQSTQQLGRFGVDQNFLSALRSRLIAKYGAPVNAVGDSFNWSLIERVADRDGQLLDFKTMWMSAYVGYDEKGKTLEMTLIDFRILWADEAAVNREPSHAAQKRIQF